MSIELWDDAFRGLAPLERAYQAALPVLERIMEPEHGFTPPFRPPDLRLRENSGLPIEQVVAEIGGGIAPHGVNYRHPLALAHMVPPSSVVSIIADLLVGGMNQCAFIWEEAPLAAQVERECIRWLTASLGWDDDAIGMLTSGGTMSNLLAAYLALSRDRAGGSFSDSVGRCIIASDQAHFSLEKGGALIGLAPGSVIRIPTCDDGRLLSGTVMRAAAEARLRGLHPFLLVCTAGTTNCGIMEPVQEFIETARHHGAWCHIDAAHGGMMTLSRRREDYCNGWRSADSISWDPHKSLYVSYAAGALLLRDPATRFPLEFHSEYALREDCGEDAGAWHLEGSRRFDALKLWMTIRHFGRRGFADIIDHTLDLAAEFARMVRVQRELLLVAEPDTNIVCFRLACPGCNQEHADRINAAVQRTLFLNGGPLISSTRIAGRTVLRAVFMNPLTRSGNLPGIIERIVAEGERQCSSTWSREREDHEDITRYQPAS